MNRRGYQFTTGLMVVVIGLVTSSLFSAAEPKSAQANWDNLKQLAPGQQIRIVLNDAKSYSGQFHSMSDNALVLRLASFVLIGGDLASLPRY